MFGKSNVPTLKVPKAPSPLPSPADANTPPGAAPASAPPPGPKAPTGAGSKSGKAGPTDRSDEFYTLKTNIHRKLVENLDLAAISNRTDDDVKEEVKQIII